MLKVKNILAGLSTDVKINGLVGLESYLQSLLEGIEMRVFIYTLTILQALLGLYNQTPPTVLVLGP